MCSTKFFLSVIGPHFLPSIIFFLNCFGGEHFQNYNVRYDGWMNEWMDVKDFFSFFKICHKFCRVIPIGLLARYLIDG